MDEKRSEIDQKRRDEIVDSLSPLQVISVMIDLFGIHRTIALIGWAIRWGIEGIENGSDFRTRCIAQGVSRATAYRASLDYRRCGDELEKRYGSQISTESLYRSVVSSDLAPYCLNA